ncbi:MAG: hypothetical protein K0Q70_135 [Rhodospirillales bacterium]|nr:hypothetical protein [Rhodospirillales bacterium]
MRTFGLGILTGFASTFAGLLLVFFVFFLVAPDRVPPPAITPISQIDEKLQFIRDNPQIDPRILAVGSSITWRQLAGDEFRNVAGGREHFLNGGVVHLQVDETHQFADFYLDNYSNVQTVLTLTGLTDFKDCTSKREPMLDPDSARGFAFDRYPSLLYYLRYFSPQRYVRGAMMDSERRAPFYGDHYIDEFGSGPVKLEKGTNLGLRYGAIATDPACIDAMAEFAEGIAGRGVQLVIVFAPIHPDYRKAFPNSIKELEQIIAEVRKRVAGGKTFVLDLHASAQFDAEDFFDAFHLMWSGAQILSEIIATELEHLHTDKALAGHSRLANTEPKSPNAH